MERSSTTRILLLFLALFAAIPATLQAQATLSVQGVLKKSDGTAVDDNTYNVTFTLWKSQGGTSMADKAWEGMLPVETKGGVYSAVLGGPNSPALTAAFDTVYYLGVKVQGSSQELQPRPLLTHAPYAMSLLGDRNKFPSRGIVRVDTITVGSIAIVDTLSVTSLVTTDLNLAAKKSIQYNGLSDWRLVQVDDFDNGVNGWGGYDDEDDSSPVTDGVEVVNTTVDWPGITNNLLTQIVGSGAKYFKKTYNLNSTPHTKIKVVYRLYHDNGLVNRCESIVGLTQTNVVSYETIWDFDIINVGSNFHSGEFLLDTDSNTFVIGFLIDGLSSGCKFYLDNIEIWVK